MFKRFGSPTKNADSGTEEEFNFAYQNKANIEIMFYFNNENISQDELDPTQFSKVKESLRYSPSEMINLLKLSMNLQDMREALLLYKERNSTSDLEISDINYHFVFLNDIIMSIGQCAANVKYHFYP